MSHHHHHCSHHDHQHCCECSHCHEHEHHDKGHHEQCDFPHQLLEMADDAWMEVLKEKIKEQIVASSGAKLDKLAKIVAESNSARWEQKLALLDIAHNFADKVRGFFSRK